MVRKTGTPDKPKVRKSLENLSPRGKQFSMDEADIIKDFIVKQLGPEVFTDSEIRVSGTIFAKLVDVRSEKKLTFKKLPNRTPISIRNYWNRKIRPAEMQREKQLANAAKKDNEDDEEEEENDDGAAATATDDNEDNDDNDDMPSKQLQFASPSNSQQQQSSQQQQAPSPAPSQQQTETNTARVRRMIREAHATQQNLHKSPAKRLNFTDTDLVSNVLQNASSQAPPEVEIDLQDDEDVEMTSTSTSPAKNTRSSSKKSKETVQRCKATLEKLVKRTKFRLPLVLHAMYVASGHTELATEYLLSKGKLKNENIWSKTDDDTLHNDKEAVAIIKSQKAVKQRLRFLQGKK